MNRPARFTVADLRRATKAAEQAGPNWAVEIDTDGTIRIVRKPDLKGAARRQLEPVEEVVF
ncbi:MAG: hypothetical protein ACRYGP_13660 [Janthinobacterium lividum]